jgi:hypothetical protein
MYEPLPQGCYVILHTSTGPSYLEEKNNTPLIVSGGDRFVLSADFWIERLEEQLAKHIQRACDPPNYNIDSVEQDRHLYAFVRRVADNEKYQYEGLDELFALIALSRLIHPTSVGSRYCAKVFHFGMEKSPIQAIQYKGVSPDAFLSNKHLDWLSVDDAEDLRQILPWLSKDKSMHTRIHRAYWNHEYAMRSLYLDMRWILVVSGLEALITVGEKNSSWQFRDRVRQLAGEFQIDLTDTDLHNAWRLRSKLVHAESFLDGLGTILPKNQHSDLYQKLESLLRTTLRRCLLDEKFADNFRDDAGVEARWPSNAKPKK